MDKNRTSSFVAIAVFFCLAWLISSCSVGEAKGKKPSENWSKGAPIAGEALGSPGMAVTLDGQQIHLVYPHDSGEGTRIRYQQLDQNAQPVLIQDLDIQADRIRRPRLLLAEENRLHLFWENREPQGGWGIWHALLGYDGNLASEPLKLTSDEVVVGRYEAAPSPSGGAVVVWDSQRDNNIGALEIGPSGEIDSDPVLIIENGSDPSVVVGADGALDFAWASGNGIHYAHLADGVLAPTTGTRIADVEIGTGDTIFGPAIGKSKGWVYVFWSRLSRSGLSAGQASTTFTAFPDNVPEEASRPQVLSILPLEEQPFRPYSGIFSLLQMVSEESTPFRTDFVYEPTPLKFELEELAVAAAAKQLDRQDEIVQPLTILFENGSFKGYTFSGKTSDISSNPRVASDAEGNLYFSWRDGSAGEVIFLSTTAPEMMTSLDRIEGGDLANTALQGSIEGLATILLFPLAIPWIVPGYIVIGLWKFYRDYESLEERSSWIVLIVAIVLYEITKFLFLPTIVDYVPFSAWIDVPSGLVEPLRIGYPIFTLVLGIFFAELNRRRGNQSTLLYYTIVVLTDVLLTLAVYGVAYLGVF